MNGGYSFERINRQTNRKIPEKLLECFEWPKEKNILLNHHVKIVECDGKKFLEIDVPAADRHDKPVYEKWIKFKWFVSYNKWKRTKIIDYIEVNGSIITQIVTKICGYQTKAGARKLLEKMTKNGMLQRIGSGPSTKYERR